MIIKFISGMFFLTGLFILWLVRNEHFGIEKDCQYKMYPYICKEVLNKEKKNEK